MNLRAIIIDDEYLARRRLATLLEKFDKIIVVEECRNGKEAIEKIQLKDPDLIFLDIQMPDINGFQVLKILKKIPYVIFTTAYDEFALKAFEINAVDYLLKPFDEERLAISLERIFELKKRETAIELETKIQKLITTYSNTNSDQPNTIQVQLNKRDVSIRTDDIIYIKSDGNYIQIFTTEKNHLHRITLNNFEKQLDPQQFFRIHRSIIVNKHYIRNIKYLKNNEYQIKLKSGVIFKSSRSYSTQISEIMDDF
jgi:two-component system LytT family response regulator